MIYVENIREIIDEIKDHYGIEVEDIHDNLNQIEKQIDLFLNEIEDKDSEIEDMKSNESELDTSTLDKQMMYEKLAQNWDRLNMSDIDAICL